MNRIYEITSWPKLSWNTNNINQKISTLKYEMGRIQGKIEGLSEDVIQKISHEALIKDISNSALLESENFCLGSVENSLDRYNAQGPSATMDIKEKQIDGYVDAYMNCRFTNDTIITAALLHQWQQNFFPFSRSGFFNIVTGFWRLDGLGLIPTTQGMSPKNKELLKAPKGSTLEAEMSTFLNWYNNADSNDVLIKCALAHLYIQVIQPYEDGNTRIACMLCDRLLINQKNNHPNVFSISEFLMKDKTVYFELLEDMRQGNGDVTDWLNWFFDKISLAFECAEQKIKNLATDITDIVDGDFELNPRQISVLNGMLNGPIRTINANVWSKKTQVTFDTALSDIQDLINKQILQKQGAGKAAKYSLQDTISLKKNITLA
ncbi:MAG: DUF4172 domain-containing protein [Bacteroidetes bacterium]|nr:DUF4172 domain-containing protein [Bacteroidota bacterium]